ncbi:hypothetical protein RJ639_041711 [Escallonia herrerae]|uniref:Reverse transcriptase RNase H-like domain-containing protein n=1 Tax=Escallonia herrerae TaxID=1293975 RepID=A0AA88WDD1_9ASTE|nr:hypothetical protein RJ639_041711 [Escallonia herrerae]
MACKCYMASCKAEEAFTIKDQLDEHAIRRAEPVHELVSITLEGDEGHHLKIGSTLEPVLRKQLISLLCSNANSYLASYPLLSKPFVGEELFLYLAVAESAISVVLIRDQDGKQLPIYYMSKVLEGAELRYPDTKKLAFALLIAAQKLRPYFQSHSIKVLMDKPL